jgi:ATP-dependent RNA helicase DDX56/DBP9
LRLALAFAAPVIVGLSQKTHALCFKKNFWTNRWNYPSAKTTPTIIIMKRKLDDTEEPNKRSRYGNQTPYWNSAASFDKLGLEPRLLQSIQQQKFSSPTPIQARAIPLALEGKDILGMEILMVIRMYSQLLARSRTGSGKTAAYVLPILHSILQRKATNVTSNSTSALILVPTNELAGQVTKAIDLFASFCAKDVRTENLARKEDDKIQRARLSGNPDIVVATPYKAASHMNSAALSVKGLTHLVIDEADLVLSYCSSKDLETIRKALPGNTIIPRKRNARLRDRQTQDNVLHRPNCATAR